MNDERRLSAAGGGQALVDTDDLARVAVPAQRTGHRAAGDPQALSHSDKRLIAVSMMLPVFLGSVDQSVLASALPTIGRDLGEVHNLPWLITAFLIASSALTPLCGKFADIYGRALNLGGIRYPWLSLPIIALFVCAMVLGAGFVLRLRTAIEPLIPIAILADPVALLAIAAHSFGWGAIISLNVFLPLYLQSALGWSPSSAGLSLVILMVTLNSTAGLSSQLLGRVRRYKLLPLCFLCIGVGAVVALALSTENMTSVRFEIILLFIGIGFGPTAPLTQVALQNTVPVHDLGAALGSMNFVRTLVATIMIAIFGAIILANAPVGARGGTLSQSFLGSASMATFSVVFLAIAVTLAASLRQSIL